MDSKKTLKWLVVWITAEDDWAVTGMEGFRSWSPARRAYVSCEVPRGMRAIFRKVPGKTGRPLWSLTEAERFGDWPGRLSDLLMQASLGREEFAL